MLPDSDLVKMAEKFIMQKIILASPTPNSPLPSTCKLGKVKGVSSWDVNNEERILEFNDLRFMGQKGSI